MITAIAMRKVRKHVEFLITVKDKTKRRGLVSDEDGAFFDDYAEDFKVLPVFLFYIRT